MRRDDWETCDLFGSTGQSCYGMTSLEERRYRLENLCPADRYEAERRKLDDDCGAFCETFD